MACSWPVRACRVRLVGVSTAIATTPRFRNKWKRISNACVSNTKCPSKTPYLLRGNVPTGLRKNKRERPDGNSGDGARH